MTFSLLLLNGPSPGQNVRLKSASAVRIGRHHSCHLQIDDDLVSREHARIEERAGNWYLEDCGSTNGTQVNSQRVDATALECGDLIRIGKRLILFIDNQHTLGAVRFRTSQWKATTMVGRPPSEGPLAPVIQRGLTGAVSRVVRDSAILCRLANELHRRQDTATLVRVAADVLADGMGADAIACWRVGTDGRLRCVGRRGTPTDDQSEPILPRLAIDRKKAIFFPPEDTANSSLSQSDPPDDLGNVGYRICVPIPGHTNCLGAIECHRLPDHPPFDRSDLDFVMVVAYQVGLAMENLEHRVSERVAFGE
jgi:pSer/pThr/pTyr-binding forkhead associated (FHA) protein